MEQDMIKQVLSDMIDYFRSRIEKLSDYEKECVQTISSLNKPCQFYIVSSPEPGLSSSDQNSFSRT